MPPSTSVSVHNLESQFSFCFRGRRHWTPLHLAAWEGQDHLVKAMINKGVDLFAIDGLSRTALHLAVQRRNRRVVRLLMQAGGETLAIREDDNVSLESRHTLPR